MPEVRSPTVRRRELGALLRKLRTDKGLTVEQAAERLLFSMSKLSRMETGHGIATPRDIRDLCDLYKVTDQAERDRLMSLAREGKQAGWWQGYDLDYFGTYVGLEAAAVEIRYYQSGIVPGLLQTAEYARAMHAAGIPKITPERTEKLIEVRLMRQRLLDQDPPLRLDVILDEAVLHREVGGAAVMRAQLDWIVKMSKRPSITTRVIPYGVGAHPAMDSTFNILAFAGSVPDVVYVEGLVGWIYVERPQDVVRYQEVFEHLRTVALTPRETGDLLLEISEEHDNSNPRSSRRRSKLELNSTANILIPLMSAGKSCRRWNKERVMSSAQPEPGQLAWRKARRSMNHGDCVEVAAAKGKIAVRDSKNPGGGWMTCSPRNWRAFVEQVKAG